jgi:large subunit ribosomal protein L31
MKTGVHPTYFPKSTISCACGNIIAVGSTAENIQVELCSNCHPFFTGKQKLIDSARRVDKFQKKVEAKTTTAIRSKRTKLQAKSAKRQLKVDETKKAPAKHATQKGS